MSSRTNNEIYIFNQLWLAADGSLNTATTPSRQRWAQAKLENHQRMDFEYSDEYARAFGDLAERQFRERFFPKEAIEDWQWLVQEVRNGYDDVPPEYDNDLDTARDPLDTFLVDDTLNTFPEHETFKQIIHQLDSEFKELTQVHPKWEQDDRKWWNNRVPKYAGRDYVEFFNSDELKKIGLTISLVDKQ